MKIFIKIFENTYIADQIKISLNKHLFEIFNYLYNILEYYQNIKKKNVEIKTIGNWVKVKN